MPFDGYTADFNWGSYTPVDSTGTNYDLFRSAYKNLRFSVQPTTVYQLTAADMSNLPGLAYRFYGDTSLWRALLSYNGIADAISEVAVGLTLQIPAKNDLVGQLSKQVNNVNQSITI
jgi:hypothetical protein